MPTIYNILDSQYSLIADVLKTGPASAGSKASRASRAGTQASQQSAKKSAAIPPEGNFSH